MSADFFAFSDIAGMDLSEPLMMIFILVYGIALLISVAYSVTVYILRSIGMYTIAKRRGIHHPGLAWVPVADMWILGSVSDQYQYVVKGKIRSRRKVLLGLMITVYVLMFVALLLFVTGIFTADLTMDAPFNASLIVSMSSSMIVFMILWVVSIIATIFLYIAYYDLFASCNPGNAVLFLVLSIFFNFLLPFFVFACRKKDEGMPPRKIQVPVAPWTPAPPPPAPAWQQSVAPQTAIQPPVAEEAPAAEDVPAEPDSTEE